MDKPGTPPISAYGRPEPEYQYVEIEHFVDSGDDEFEHVETDAHDVVQEEVRTEFTPLRKKPHFIQLVLIHFHSQIHSDGH